MIQPLQKYKDTCFLGTHQVVGVAPDSKFVLTRNNDLVIPQVGVDGDVALSLSRNRTGTLTINLLGVSDTNQYDLALFVLINVIDINIKAPRGAFLLAVFRLT